MNALPWAERGGAIGRSPGAQTNLITSNDYDTHGRLVATTAPDPSETTGTPLTPDDIKTQYAYDDTGRLCGVVENATGSTDLAALGEPCTDPTQAAGTTTANLSTQYTYDPAGNLASMEDASGDTTTYSCDEAGNPTGRTDALGETLLWRYDAMGNRTGQTGSGTPATTAYDAANRPVSGANPTAAYASDADGRLTARPGQTMTWDPLGRLKEVKDASGSTTIAAYTYDPLDRLRIADDGTAGRTRFRYTGTTTAVAGWIDDTTGTVIRNVANGWRGERLLDWTGTGSDPRTYGTNAHHDITWLADASGAVRRVDEAVES